MINFNITKLWMSSLIGLSLFFGSALGNPADELRVVATIPDLANLAEEIGGELVTVRSLSRGSENLHSIPVRPSMLIALSKADLFLQMGLSMEAAWLPDLMIRAKNEQVRPGATGFQNCSAGWQAIQVPKQLSRRQGDIHREGNPHFNLDPMGGAHLAKAVHQALVRVDPKHEENYDAGLERWMKRLESKRKQWDAIAKKVKGGKIAVYHTEYAYLAARLGLEVVVSIEPKPGIPPGPTDVARVVGAMKEHEVNVILTASWSNNRQVADIARRTGATIVELPNQVKGADWATGWIELMDGVHERLAKAFQIE
ncbi:MAG: zinc/manganese transport system substrate-binding protein [Planctomycetota bacterium]|jgi:zinc/manganese transport system substrate-binding protein